MKTNGKSSLKFSILVDDKDASLEIFAKAETNLVISYGLNKTIYLFILSI